MRISSWPCGTLEGKCEWIFRAFFFGSNPACVFWIGMRISPDFWFGSLFLSIGPLIVVPKVGVDTRFFEFYSLFLFTGTFMVSLIGGESPTLTCPLFSLTGIFYCSQDWLVMIFVLYSGSQELLLFLWWVENTQFLICPLFLLTGIFIVPRGVGDGPIFWFILYSCLQELVLFL